MADQERQAGRRGKPLVDYDDNAKLIANLQAQLAALREERDDYKRRHAASEASYDEAIDIASRFESALAAANQALKDYHQDFYGTNIVWFEEAKKANQRIEDLTAGRSTEFEANQVREHLESLAAKAALADEAANPIHGFLRALNTRVEFQEWTFTAGEVRDWLARYDAIPEAKETTKPLRVEVTEDELLGRSEARREEGKDG